MRKEWAWGQCHCCNASGWLVQHICMCVAVLCLLKLESSSLLTLGPRPEASCNCYYLFVQLNSITTQHCWQNPWVIAHTCHVGRACATLHMVRALSWAPSVQCILILHGSPV